MSFNRYVYVNNNPYKYTDPDGEFANFAIGATVGALAEVVVQTVIEGKSLGELDGGRIMKSAAIGFVSGGVGGAAGKLGGKVSSALTKPASAMHRGASLTVKGAMSGSVSWATGGAVSSTLKQLDSTGTVDLKQVGKSALLGAVTGAVSGGVSGKIQSNAVGRVRNDSRTQALFTSNAPGEKTGTLAGTVICTASGVGKAVNSATENNSI